MGMKLSENLSNLGFFLALASTEHAGPKGTEIPVQRGTPLTTDYNNGVRVVYDEIGRPWILYAHGVEEMLKIEAAGYKLVIGAHVPHSNDGGHFVREIMPKLMEFGVKRAEETPLHEDFAKATAAAEVLLAGLRHRHAADIPLSVWRMMTSAESKLNKELREYFVPTR